MQSHMQASDINTTTDSGISFLLNLAGKVFGDKTNEVKIFLISLKSTVTSKVRSSTFCDFNNPLYLFIIVDTTFLAEVM